jgi:hypothetical protein
MLHPINPPSCVNELLMLVDLQKKMLEFAEANCTYSDAAFKASVSNKFVDWLLDLKINGRKDAKKVATDFWNDLRQYIQCVVAEKSQVLADFTHDQDYYVQIDNPSFIFSLVPTKSTAHEIASKLLNKFYSLLSEGYPSELVGHAPGLQPFSKSSLVAGYVKSNPNIEYVCPCCDNAFTEVPRTIDGQGYTIEHYFPKSIYPSICVHPMNLIPMCEFCNKRKENIDPLNPLPLPISFSMPYSEVFHPHSRPVRSLATLEFSTTATSSENMEFVAKNPPPMYKNSIEAYRIMYQIPERWNKNRARVDSRIALYIKRVQKRFSGAKIDDTTFDQILRETIAELEDSFGIDHLSYPAASWLTWARAHKFQDLKQAFLPS